MLMDASTFLLFLSTSFFVVATPGPGVIMSITSVIRYGFRGGIWAIFGVASGTIAMAVISSSGLGLIIATSPNVFAAIKLLGAAYLVYLGQKLLRSKPYGLMLAHKQVQATQPQAQCVPRKRLWLEGIVLQMTNPLLIMFFVALFPQFVNHESALIPQLALLCAGYFSLVMLIHSAYGFIAENFRVLLTSQSAALWVNRLSGSFFLFVAAKVALDCLV